MRRDVLWALGFAAVTVLFTLSAFAGDQPGAAKRVGIDERVPWTTSKVIGSPEPPAPYRTQQVFPKLKFFEPLEMAAVPDTNRLLIAERLGKIFSFVNDHRDAEAELCLDIKKTIYGVVPHPKFTQNGYLFVTYILDPKKEEPKGTRVVRFTVDRDTWKADPKSEKLILEWPSGGHNAGCLRFGPDGYLYIVCGDGSGIADELHTGQDLSDLLASILRIDIDRPAAGQGYSIPKDNPFIKTPGARPEIYAYGLRQVWKMGFDSTTGDLWGCDVGQDLWESVHLIKKGGNYGWSVMEATHPFRPERKRGPTPIIAPVVEHPHVDYRSVTGGYVYRGKSRPELEGYYIYGDYDTGKVNAFRYDPGTGKAVGAKELVDTPFRIICFGQDQQGELYIVDFMNGTIHQLVPSTSVEPTLPFPKKLSQTGLFASTKEHQPASGLIPYSVNAELWSDNAHKERFLALPGRGQIDFDGIEYPQPSPGAPRGWRFPDGTVVVKTFSMDMEQGNPASRKRLETRILHFEQLAGTEEVGDQIWRGYTYIWNDDQTDAELCEKSGRDVKLSIKDDRAPGGKREQNWHFPSRSECTLCHTMPAKYVLGVNTLQMNKDHDYGHGRVANQLATLEHLGIFKRQLPKKPDDLPHLVNYRDEKQDLNKRARSYLHANCAHCHMKWGGGNADFLLVATVDLDQTNSINTRVGQGKFELKDPRVIVPGVPDRSMILFRMRRLGLGRMPHVGSNVVDDRGAQLIEEWLRDLGDHPSKGLGGAPPQPATP